MVEQGHTVTVFCRSIHYAARPATYLGMQLRYLPAVREKHLETLSHPALSSLQLPRPSAVICLGVGNAPVVRMLELSGRFFFQAEDGIRYSSVTGVQTCALPI